MFRMCAGVLIVFCSVVLSSEVSYATSAYDTAYRTTNRLLISTPGREECSNINISADWASYILDSSKWTNPGDATNQNSAMSQARASFQAMQADNHNGTYAISQIESGDGYKNVRVMWTQQPTAYLQWRTDGVVLRSSVNYLNIICNDQIGDLSTDWKVVAQEPYLYQVGRTISEPQSNVANFAFITKRQNFNYAYPNNYEGSAIKVTLPSMKNYVALGDSFSSGEGNPPFSGDSGDCHRSEYSYPRKLASNPNLFLTLTHFVACSGATTSNIMNESSQGVPAQVSAISPSTEIVTLTAGGNDVGFQNFAKECTLSLCDFNTQAYQNIRDSILNDLPEKLMDTYSSIDEASSNNTKIYVLGYPHLAPSIMPTGQNSLCWPLNGGINNPDSTKNNGAAVHEIQDELNNVIQNAVNSYNSSKFEYIDPNSTNSPFVGHDWCSSDKYFNILTINSLDHSYHPNVQGHSAYATIVTNSL